MCAPVWKANNSFGHRFLFFGRNSNIHGLKFILQEKNPTILRVFWLLVLLASGGCLYLLLTSVIQQNAHISFTPDTLYADWTTIFPALTFCERYNSFSYRAAMKKFGDLYPDLLGTLEFKYKRHLTDILYSEGRCIGTLCEPCGSHVPCDLMWRNISVRIRKKCDELITNCTYNSKSFPCCEYFRQVDSEKGPCFAINTSQNKFIDASTNCVEEKTVKFCDISSKLPGNEQLVVNRTTGPSILSFNIIYPADLSIHSPEELSTKYLDPNFLFTVNPTEIKNIELLFSIVEMHNEVSLHREKIEHRKCRFPYEVPEPFIHSYKVYSYGACKLAEETRDKLKNCGCIHPVRDLSYEKMYCNFTGITCLMKYDKKYFDLSEDTNADYCLPSCIESEINIINIHTDSYGDLEEAASTEKNAIVSIRMASLPSLRYVRHLLRTDLDLVVSIGGMLGLFFGASILSLVETVYLILRSTN